MFQVLILICSMTFSSSECQTETALDVIRGPAVPNEIMCGLHGQAYIAQTSLVPRGPDEYVKIVCMRSVAAQHVLRRRAPR